jgi:small-conductance mechanosensitive channel
LTEATAIIILTCRIMAILSDGGMMPENVAGMDGYMAALVTVGISILVGLVIQFIISSRLVKYVNKTPWKGDNVIVEGIRGRIVLWSVLIGIYLALPMLHLPPQYYLLAKKIMLVLIILMITLTASSIVGGFIRAYAEETYGEILSTSIFSIFSKIVIISIGFLVILQTLEISITPILTALGVGGLALALALQDTLGNLFAGLNILISGKIKVGDYIKLQSGEEGYIIDITWRNTSIRQLSDNCVIIPNSKLASSIATNFNLPQANLWVSVPLTVASDSDLERVEKAALEVAREVLKEIEGGLIDPEPSVRFQNFSDLGIALSINLCIKEYSKQYRIRHELIKRIQKRFREEKIVFPLPLRAIGFAAEKKGDVAETN